ncbi:MAG: threonine/serine dehydratase [candidate division NC10 bacterium]|nr:threonine/serine dehydratase [candidate division NC10 bacterium]
MQPPTLQDVYRARQVVYRYMAPTPLIRSAAMSEALGCEIYLKLETVTPIGAFKVRGGLNFVAQLPEEERTQGVITASTGNHGQSIAYAAKTFGVRAVIAAPEGANPDKVAAMRRLGADVVLTGRDFDESRVWAQEEARLKGYRYVHPANEPLLIAGVGTASLEIMEALPDVDAVLVPIGGGSGASSHCLVAKRLSPKVKVIGVQAEKAPAMYLSWKAGRKVETPEAATWAEGVATRTPFDLPFEIIREHLDDIVLVSEEEMRQGVISLLEAAHQLAEAAGAAPAAAARKIQDRLRGQKVVLIVSGANITRDQLTRVLTDPQAW